MSLPSPGSSAHTYALRSSAQMPPPPSPELWHQEGRACWARSLAAFHRHWITRSLRWHSAPLARTKLRSNDWLVERLVTQCSRAPLSRGLPEPSSRTDIGRTPTCELRGTTKPKRYRWRVEDSHRRTSPGRCQLRTCREKYRLSPSLSPSSTPHRAERAHRGDRRERGCGSCSITW